MRYRMSAINGQCVPRISNARYLLVRKYKVNISVAWALLVGNLFHSITDIHSCSVLSQAAVRYVCNNGLFNVVFILQQCAVRAFGKFQTAK